MGALFSSREYPQFKGLGHPLAGSLTPAVLIEMSLSSTIVTNHPISRMAVVYYMAPLVATLSTGACSVDDT